MSDSPEVPAPDGPAYGTMPEGSRRTSLYLPGEMLPAVDRARAAGKSYADLIRDGLATLEPPEHEHAYRCAFCGSPPDASLVLEDVEGTGPGLAELLAAERRRTAELEEILGSDRASAASGDLEGNLLAAREQLERAGRENGELREERDLAQRQHRHAQGRIAELADEVEQLRRQLNEAGQDGEPELRQWREWAGAVCQALDITDPNQVLPWIRELRDTHGSPLPLSGGLSASAHPETPEDASQPGSGAPGDAEGLPGEFTALDALVAEGGPPEDSAWATDPGDDGWPSSFPGGASDGTDDEDGDES